MRPIYGEYECKVDAKGRFLFPSALMKLLPENQSEFVINRGLDPCLVIFPLEVWESELKEIFSRNQFIEKNRNFARLFQNGATPVTLDNQNRVLIPKRLLEQGEIKSDLILIGSYDRIELWSKEKYEKWLDSHQNELPQLSEEVMKKGGNDE